MFAARVRGLVCLAAAIAASASAQERLARTDHYVKVKSTAPAMAGQDALIYVREVSTARPSRGVALFVHGSGTPAEVSFDVPYKDYSWMAYLARAGFDVFAMDMTGYGRSTRPYPMNDACNFQKSAQAQFVPGVIAAPCAPSRKGPITSMASDWNDIAAVVERLRALRKVDKISLVAWSQGGPRTAGYVLRNPEKVARLVVLAPAYGRTSPAQPAPARGGDGPMTAQSRADFDKNWDRQVVCPGQYEKPASNAVWTQMLASDPVGASWGPGVRRAPQVASVGFNKDAAARMRVPYLMVTGAGDKQVPPERVRELYEDLGSKDKVLIDLGCSSHNAMWERNHLMLFRASLEWLRDGKVGGVSQGLLKMGYPGRK